MLLLSPAILGPSLLLLVLFTLARRLCSPLARLPGPWHTKFTSLVLKWHEWHARRTNYIHDLHVRHGPVVRLGPNEASFASAAAVKEIYGSGGSGYDKTEFYDLFTVYGRRTMFSTRDKEAHARRKRMLADRYANSNVLKGESIHGVEERSGRFVARVTSTDKRNEDGAVDIYTALHAYAFDCASHHLFHPLGADSLRSDADERIMLEVTTDSSLQNRLVRYWSPTLHRLVSGVLDRVAPPRATPLADRFVLDNSARGGEARPFTLLSRLSDKNNHGDDTTGIAAECLDHMAAGIDTTGDALCFLMWELSQPRSRRFQEALRRELRRARAEGRGWHELPYLDAVVNEGLRCFPAIPMSLPRYVPRGGRTVDGYALPAHTIVSSQPYSVHRLDTAVFPDPDRFDPGRWLGLDEKDAGAEERREQRKRSLFAFSAGGRGCVGKHLALAEMKILLRDVYARYRTEPGAGMRDEDMAMEHQLISSRPRGQRCLMRFVPCGEV